MILVAGGTGRLGSVVVVEALSTQGSEVRVLTRSPESAVKLRSAGVRVAVGDIRDAVAVAEAVRGCAAVVSAVSGFGPMGSSTPANVDREGNIGMIRAARAAGVKHFVLVSMHGVAQQAGLPLLRMKHAAEESLKGSGLSWTIIRPTACLERYLAVMSESLRKSGATVVFGSGRIPVNFVSVYDVAAAVERALTDPQLRGTTIELGGHDLTLNQLSDAVQAKAGPVDKTRHIPLPALRLMAIAARPFSPFLARAAQAAVHLNSGDMTFDAGPERQSLPGLPFTSLADAVARLR